MFALVSPNYYPLTCGVGDHSMRLGAELRRRGHQATVFTHAPATANPDDPDVPVVGVAEGPSLRVAADVAREVIAGGFSHAIIQYTPQMWGASRFGSPAIPLLAARLTRQGVDVTFVLHEAYTPWYRRPDLVVGAAFFRLQVAAALGSAARFFVTTESRREAVREVTGALVGARPAGVLRVGPNALPSPSSRPPGGHRMGVFSTRAVGKSFDAVLDAFDEIAQVHEDAELILIGDLGPSSTPAGRALAERIGASAMGSRVRLTGKLSLAEVAWTISSLDLYLFPMDTGANTRSGTLPVALGSAVPVVAIRGIETDPMFVHGENVYFADGLDGPSFARAALRIFADPVLGGGIAQGGRRLYERYLSWERIADDLLAALD